MAQPGDAGPELGAWLAEAGLAHRAAQFQAHDILPEHLPELTDDDLRELGLTIGERKQLRRHLRDAAPRPQPPRTLAERRPLTVAFVDLADSTALAERLDAEDLIEVIRAYREFCAAAIERYGGRVAQYSGDGILACFCYPVAHENDAERAVRAALEIAEGVRKLATPAGTPLRVRVGVATGRVVIGNLFGGATLDARLVNGSTLNLAARLQAMAPPNGVLLSELVHERVGALFVIDDLGPRELRGFSAPQHVFHALQPRGGRAHAPPAARLTPLFAREAELETLSLRWEQAAAGKGGCVLVTGEAGIGKSRLVERFIGVLDDRSVQVVRVNCSPFDQDSLFRPFLGHFRTAARFDDQDGPEVRLRKLAGILRGPDAAAHLRVLADLLQVHPDPELAGLPPPVLRERGLAALCGQVLALLEDGPLCLVVEDLHWIDPTSRALVGLLAREAGTRRLLLVLTARDAAPLALPDGVRVLELRLTRLEADDVAAMVQSMFGDEPLPHAVARQIAEKTDGLPLFVEEYVRPLLRTGPAVDWSRIAQAPGDAVAIPASLHDSLMARLDRSGPAKEVAQVAAVIGRIARRDVLAAAAGLAPDALHAALAALHDAGVLHAHAQDGRDCYAFGHALVREAAYDSLLRDRRRELHGRVARALLELDPEGVELQPELLALHLTEANLTHEAVGYWLEAARRSLRRSALLEAVRLLRRGLAAADSLHDEEARAEHRLQFMALLGPALIALRGPGSSETQELYAQAYAAVADRDEAQHYFPLAWGWWRVGRDYVVRSERAATMLAKARRQEAPDLLLQAHHCNWATRFELGDLDGCVRHVREGMAIYGQGDYRGHASLYGNHDARVCAHGELAQVHWMQGRLTEGVAEEARSLEWAASLGHLGSRVHAMDMALLHRSFRRDHRAVLSLADELIAFTAGHGLSDHRSKGLIFRGWATAMAGDTHRGLDALRSGFARQREIGTLEDFPIYVSLLADALLAHGRADQAVDELTRARAEFDAIGLRIWMPEVLRSLGAAILAADPGAVGAATEAFADAATAAAEQGAHMLGLRVALDQAALAERTGRRDLALTRLRAAVGAVPDAAATKEGRTAREMLDRLAPGGAGGPARPNGCVPHPSGSGR